MIAASVRRSIISMIAAWPVGLAVYWLLTSLGVGLVVAFMGCIVVELPVYGFVDRALKHEVAP